MNKSNLAKKQAQPNPDKEVVIDQLTSLGIQAKTPQDQADIDEISNNNELREFLKSLLQQKGSPEDQAIDIGSVYINEVEQAFDTLETLSYDAKHKDNEELRSEISRLKEQEQAINPQMKLLDERLQTLEGEVGGLKKLQQNLKEQNTEARAYRKEYLKQAKLQIQKLAEQFTSDINANTEALNAKSTSDFYIRISILSEYLRKEKEWLGLCVEKTEGLRDEFSKANQDAKPSKEYKAIANLKKRIVNDEKEKLLLDLALGKFSFAIKYMKDSVYKDGVIKFDVNSYKKISPEEYGEIIDDLNSEIQELLGQIVSHHERQFTTEADEVIKSTDDKYHINQAYQEKLQEVEKHLKLQNERLAAVGEYIKQEEGFVQDDYDKSYERFDYLKLCLEKLDGLNESLQDVYDREVNTNSISVRDEYVIEIAKLLRTSALRTNAKAKKTIFSAVKPGDKDILVMQDDLVNLIKDVNDQENENEEERAEKFGNMEESLLKILRAGFGVVDTVKQYDEPEVPGAGKVSMQKLWHDNLQKIRTERAELDLALNKAFQRLQTIQKRRAVDPVTKINEKDLIVQYMLEKSPIFIERLKNL